jgi:hypothetical protein
VALADRLGLQLARAQAVFVEERFERTPDQQRRPRECARLLVGINDCAQRSIVNCR